MIINIAFNFHDNLLPKNIECKYCESLVKIFYKFLAKTEHVNYR